MGINTGFNFPNYPAGVEADGTRDKDELNDIEPPFPAFVF